MRERLVGAEFERSKTLRVIDAERRRDAAETETDKVLELWQKTEAELTDALVKIEELEQKLIAASSRETFLAGRLEQRNADWVTALRQDLRDAEHKARSDDPDVAIPSTGAVPVTVIICPRTNRLAGRPTMRANRNLAVTAESPEFCGLSAGNLARRLGSCWLPFTRRPA